MRIGMILDAPFPPDIRVEKEAKSLKAAGHEIYVLSQHRKSFHEKEIKEHYVVIRFNTNAYRRLKQLTRDLKKIIFMDLVWKKGIDRFIRENRIDVLHVHDLPLVRTAYAVAKKYQIPIIADFHENFPAHIQAISGKELSLKKRFYQSYKRWEKYEESISQKVDRIIVVAEEYKNHLIAKHKVPADKMTIVQNTIDMSQFRLTNNINIKLTSHSDFVISYIGSYGPHRGLDIVIQALPEILSHIPMAKFIIVGRGNNKEDLQSLSKKLNIEKSIKFFDWINYEKLGHEFKKANIGVIPHNASEHTNTTIPNKLFEYMYFKVPVITSDLPPLKRIIEETKAGKVFEAGNSEDFAKKVVEVYRAFDSYGEMGYKAVIEKYNWGVDGERLVNLYNSLASNKAYIE